MKTKYKEGLSIVIPSYNRSSQLCRLLDSIFNDDIKDVIEIIVVDNNSDYDVKKVLCKYSSKKLKVVQNSFNVKMATNMMNTFLHCRTKWMWLISDDDVICQDSIKIANNRIAENADAGYLKFSTEGTGNNGIERNMMVNSLEDFINYYSNESNVRRGNLVFVSNGIYNLELIHPFLGYGFEFSYTYIPYLIPVILGLNNGIPVVFCQEKIVKYQSPENGHWSFDNVGLGLSTLSHLPLLLEKKYFKELLNILMVVKFKGLFLYLLKSKKNNSRRKYNLVYHNVYKYYLTPFQKILSHLLSLLLIYPKLTSLIFKKYV